MTSEEVKEFEGYKAKAEKGDAKAQYAVGVCYEQGLGVVVDFVQAAAWYRKAADQGHPADRFNLDEVDELHPGFTSADFEGAASWCRKSAEQGDAEAQYNLGFYYESRSDRRDNEVSFHNGCSMPGDEVYEAEHFGGFASADNVQAVAWYRKGAEQGYAEAQYALGACYRNGRGVAKDFVQAVSWFRKAAEQGYAEAQYILGGFYYTGWGVAKDCELGVEWYRKAAEQGHADAQSFLGSCYLNGEGATKDVIEAYAYWSIPQAGKSRLARLDKTMSSHQILAGQKRSKEIQKVIDINIAAKKDADAKKAGK